MKKKVIIGILIAILLIAAIMVNIYAMKGKNQDIITPPQNETISQNDMQDEDNEDLDELELTGDKYNVEEGTDSEGNKISATTEEGKAMIMLYWNTKEENSMEAVKILQNYYDTYSEKVSFMLVTAMDSEEEEKGDAENFLAENNINMPVMYEVIANADSTANEITNIPTLLVINKRGEKINTLIDRLTADTIEANLDIISENF